MDKTLIIVDMQNDFLSNGSLKIKGGDELIPVINSLIPFFDHVIASQDWHPSNHISFASRHGKSAGETILVHGRKQRLWPVHCVEFSKGAEVSAYLDTKKIELTVYKGRDLEFDSYSVFFDEGGETTHLFEYLLKKDLFALYFAGLTTEYCVHSSVLDALSLGFSVFVIQDAIAAVYPGEKEEEWALNDMKRKGAKFIRSSDVFSGGFANG